MKWNEFVKSIAELYKAGKTEEEISQELGGSLLEGRGKVKRVENDSEYTPFIQVNMPRITVPHGRKKIVANFLCLNFSSLTTSQVEGYREGTSINFKTHIIFKNGPFPGISIFEYDDEKESLLCLVPRIVKLPNKAKHNRPCKKTYGPDLAGAWPVLSALRPYS